MNFRLLIIFTMVLSRLDIVDAGSLVDNLASARSIRKANPNRTWRQLRKNWYQEIYSPYTFLPRVKKNPRIYVGDLNSVGYVDTGSRPLVEILEPGDTFIKWGDGSRSIPEIMAPAKDADVIVLNGHGNWQGMSGKGYGDRGPGRLANWGPSVETGSLSNRYIRDAVRDKCVVLAGCNTGMIFDEIGRPKSNSLMVGLMTEGHARTIIGMPGYNYSTVTEKLIGLLRRGEDIPLLRSNIEDMEHIAAIFQAQHPASTDWMPLTIIHRTD